MKRTIMAGVLLAALACQTYSTVNAGAVPAGATVQVTLTDNGSNYVAPLIGSRAERLSGTVSHADTSGITMSVSELTRVGGATELGEGKLVQVPTNMISTVTLQSTSVGRSVLLGGAIAAGAILAGRTLGAGSGSTLRGGGPVVAGH